MTHTLTWDEPAGATPRGTLVVLPGRGESPAAYARFGRRLAADGYRVRLVPVDPDDPGRARTRAAEVLADRSSPQPRVLVGSDTGASLAAAWAASLPVDGLVLAGLALPGSTSVGSWSAEVEARSACPVHRGVIADDADFVRGALAAVPSWVASPQPSDRPTLVLHGTADPVTPADAALAPFTGTPSAWVRLVDGGRHDVLNDASHRSVAATVVLFLESLRLGADLPVVVRPAGADLVAAR